MDSPIKHFADLRDPPVATGELVAKATGKTETEIRYSITRLAPGPRK